MDMLQLLAHVRRQGINIGVVYEFDGIIWVAILFLTFAYIERSWHHEQVGEEHLRIRLSSLVAEEYE